MSWPFQKYVKFPFVVNQNIRPINGVASNSISIGIDAGFTNNGTNVGLSGFLGSGFTFPIAGYTTTIGSPNFSAGDGLACVIRQQVPTWNIPFGPTGGIISATVYTKFNN